MKRNLIALFALAACDGTTEIGEPPSPTPPAPWGAPLSGGTMIVTRDGSRAVISDPDRDRVVTVDLASREVIAEVALAPNDEPGRLVEDAAGRIHVALRRGGQLVTLAGDAVGGGIDRRAVCGEPRGVAYDEATDTVHVACAGGELVSLPAAGGAPTRALRLDRDLRDVIVDGARLEVTRFRSAEVLTLDATGAVVERVVPPIVKRRPMFGPGTAVDAAPAVAWRTIALPGGRIVMTHQRQIMGELETTPGGYGGECLGGPIESAVTVIEPGGAPRAVRPIAVGALPLDVAVSPSNGEIAIVVAGAHAVAVADASTLATPEEEDCPDSFRGGPAVDDGLGLPSSVAYQSDGSLLVYYPELPALVRHRPGLPPNVVGETIALTGSVGYDSGRALFHTQTQLRIACASCHPEGREDGRVWTFNGLGPRRTQSLGGHILQRGPYHWTGDEADLSTLMDDVFANRMAGGPITNSQRLSLGPWLDRLPAPAAPAALDDAAVARGRALFDSAATGCTTCHSGALLTSNQRFDVATGGTFKVPSLVGVGARAPFMHDGCAATLHDRFGACGGGDSHGHTAALSAVQLGDLVAYLETL